jgi:formate-dependent nitrite reductase membrane component NrfD
MSYYGLPVLKPPVWTWEVPAYFFVGGAAGAAAVIGAVGRATGAPPDLVRDARWIAAAGGVLAPPLLISDLGRP